MELLKMVEECKKINEEARKVTEDLKTSLRNQFVDLRFEIKLVEIEERSSFCRSGKDRLDTVYYPILEVPKGYIKENEKYVRECLNALNHIYTLKDETGTQVEIEEHAIYQKDMYNTTKGRITIRPFNMVSKIISYKIKVSGETYKFERKYEYEAMLQMILKRKLGRAKYWESDQTKTYSSANKKFEELIKSFGEDKKVISLNEIVKSKITELNLNDYLVAKFKYTKIEIERSGWISNSIFGVYICEIPFVCNEVNVQIYYRGDKILNEQDFKWAEIKEQRLKKGITLQEAIELIK